MPARTAATPTATMNRPKLLKPRQFQPDLSSEPPRVCTFVWTTDSRRLVLLFALGLLEEFPASRVNTSPSVEKPMRWCVPGWAGSYLMKFSSSLLEALIGGVLSTFLALLPPVARAMPPNNEPRTVRASYGTASS